MLSGKNVRIANEGKRKVCCFEIYLLDKSHFITDEWYKPLLISFAKQLFGYEQVAEADCEYRSFYLVKPFRCFTVSGAETCFRKGEEG